MKNLMLWMARGAAFVGALLCAVAVLVRLSGAYTLGSFQIGTVLIAGMAAVLLACLGYLVVLVEGRTR